MSRKHPKARGEAQESPAGKSGNRRKALFFLTAAGALLLALALARFWWVGGFGFVQQMRTGMPVLLPSERAERVFLADIRKAAPYERGGQFFLGPEFLDIFNSFTAQYLDKDRELLLRAFGQWAQDNYSAEVAHYLFGVFGKYLEYLGALREPGLFPADSTPGQKLEIMVALRNNILGEETAKLLFRDQDERLRYAILLRGIAEDPDLTEEQKRAKVEELKDSLDPETRERIFPTDEHQEYLEKLEKIEKETAGLPAAEQAAKVRDLRMQMFGPEAAGRLEELDKVRQERAEREALYEQERAKIAADTSLSEEQRKQKIQELQGDVLRPEQIRRLQALEALEKMTPGEIARQIKAQQEGAAPTPDTNDPAQQGANVGVEERK